MAVKTKDPKRIDYWKTLKDISREMNKRASMISVHKTNRIFYDKAIPLYLLFELIITVKTDNLFGKRCFFFFIAYLALYKYISTLLIDTIRNSNIP